jgi:PiT family inorganic phosphate transporter
MLVALFAAALIWNVGTWWLGIPNSSSHALIGALIGIAVESALVQGRGFQSGVDWHQIGSVLTALLISPLLGFTLAFALFKLMQAVLKDRRLYDQPTPDTVPVWWMRALLILTCTGVSFSHGTNDGQKSIGLMMLAIIGLMPGDYALNLAMTRQQIADVAAAMPAAAELIGRLGDDQKQRGIDSAHALRDRFGRIEAATELDGRARQAARNDLNRVLQQLNKLIQAKGIADADKASAKALHGRLTGAVHYAPWWVRLLSALCLGVGTMVGYRRVVKTLGEGLGKAHLVPAQGAAAELVGAGLIGFAGFSGYPVSTTHVVTGGITGTMVAARAGVQHGTLRQVAAAWILTLPATMAISGVLFWVLS